VPGRRLRRRPATPETGQTHDRFPDRVMASNDEASRSADGSHHGPREAPCEDFLYVFKRDRRPE